jgi:hypothetical protein
MQAIVGTTEVRRSHLTFSLSVLNTLDQPLPLLPISLALHVMRLFSYVECVAATIVERCSAEAQRRAQFGILSLVTFAPFVALSMRSDGEWFRKLWTHCRIDENCMKMSAGELHQTFDD